MECTSAPVESCTLNVIDAPESSVRTPMLKRKCVRSEGAIRNPVDPAKIMQDIKSADFGIAAYKGQKLSLRDWDWQVRQPILLSDGRAVVSVSPQPGFLHQVTELDTMGFDRPETKCRLQ